MKTDEAETKRNSLHGETEKSFFWNGKSLALQYPGPADYSRPCSTEDTLQFSYWTSTLIPLLSRFHKILVLIVYYY